jgi:hypothetical protein
MQVDAALQSIPGEKLGPARPAVNLGSSQVVAALDRSTDVGEAASRFEGGIETQNQGGPP